MMYMGQHNPYLLDKIKPNIEDLKKLLRPEDSLLDAGCYHGHLFGHLNHANYLGIDLFPENVEQAKKCHPTGRFEQRDIRELEGEWDVIFCCRVLMHLLDWEKALARLKACYRRHLVLAVPLGGYIVEEEPWEPGKPTYFQRFHQSQFEGCTKINKHEKYATVIYG